MNERSFEEKSSPESKPERKARETRAALVEAALDLFARQGFAATSVKQIAQTAGVSQGLLYNYFPSKEALFWSILETQSFAPVLRRILEDAPDRLVAELLRRVGEGFQSLIREQPRMFRLILQQAAIDPQVGEMFRNYVRQEATAFHHALRARMDAGELRPHDPEVTLRLLISPIITLSLLGPGGLAQPETFIAEIVETLLRGIAAPHAGTEKG